MNSDVQYEHNHTPELTRRETRADVRRAKLEKLGRREARRVNLAPTELSPTEVLDLGKVVRRRQHVAGGLLALVATPLLAVGAMKLSDHYDSKYQDCPPAVDGAMGASNNLSSPAMGNAQGEQAIISQQQETFAVAEAGCSEI